MRLDDKRRAATLYRYIEPHRGRLIVVGPGIVCMGPVDRYLGLLSETLGELPRARRYLEDAMKQARAIDAEPWYARACVDLAATGVSDSAALVSQARSIAERLGMKTVLERSEMMVAKRKIGLGIICSGSFW